MNESDIQLENSEKLAEFLISNWTPDQVVEFALKLLGTFAAHRFIVVEAFRLFMMRFISENERVSFCLHMLGDEAQAWWAGKQDHQS